MENGLKWSLYVMIYNKKDLTRNVKIELTVLSENILLRENRIVMPTSWTKDISDIKNIKEYQGQSAFKG